MRKPITSRAKCSPAKMKSPLYMANGPGDKTKKGPGDNTSKEEKARELARKRAEEARAKAGKNKGDSKNVRTFKGEASYVVPGKKVERYAKTAEEIAAWKKAPEKNKAKYRDQNKKVVETVSDTGVDKQKSTKKKKDNNVHFYKGSNMHNKNFGGRTSYGRSREKPDPNDYPSYSRSPSKPASGKPNTFESRPATDRETKAMKSRFFSAKANPFKTPGSWGNYLTQIENREAKLQSKTSERNKLVKNKRSQTESKKAEFQAKKAKRAAEKRAFMKNKR